MSMRVRVEWKEGSSTQFYRVDGLGSSARDELLTHEFGCESHCEVVVGWRW